MICNENPFYERLNYRDLDDLVQTTVQLATISFRVAAVVGNSAEVVNLLAEVERLVDLTRPAIEERRRRHSAAAALVRDID